MTRASNGLATRKAKGNKAKQNKNKNKNKNPRLVNILK
jgi:hypothetical protein